MYCTSSQPRGSWPLILGLVLLASCGDPGTALRVALQYDDAWSLDTARVEVEAATGSGPIAPVLHIPVSTDLDGRAVEVTVRGLAGQELVAVGRGSATVVAGRTTDVAVTLTRVPCGDWCAPGQLACRGDAVVTCETAPDGCTRWGIPEPCGGDRPFCSLGVCADDCVDECATGESRCLGPGMIQRCGQSDADDCLDWRAETSCGEGTVCSGGACVEQCADECTAGDVACSGAGVSTCDDRNLDGCTEWGPAAPCAAGQSCSDGACSSECSDECTGTSCVGPVLSGCGQYDLDECLDRSPGTSCVATDPCRVGTCTTGGCMEGPRTCDEPPASECVAPDTLRVFDAAGTCAAGTCEYQSRDIACPGCPDCDACTDVVCDTPPSVCFQAAGDCDEGSCTYPVANGVACDDQNACTQADVCAGGVCAGTKIICDTPPPPVCTSSTTLRTYDAPGDCAAGSCSYPFGDMTCAGACVAGACQLARADFVRFYGNGVRVALSTGSAFAAEQTWSNAGAENLAAVESVELGDVDGDGDVDVGRMYANGVTIQLSTGASFDPESVWSDVGAANVTEARAFHLADVDGDGRDDLVRVFANAVAVGLSSGSDFAATTQWLATGASSLAEVASIHLADVDGDGRDDLVRVFTDGVGVYRSTGTSFGPVAVWSSMGGSPLVELEAFRFHDVTGDGRADFLLATTTGVSVAPSTGTGFGAVVDWGGPGTDNATSRRALKYGDVDGDGRADLVVAFADATGVYRSTGAGFTSSEIWSDSTFETLIEVVSLHIADVGP